MHWLDDNTSRHTEDERFTSSDSLRVLIAEDSRLVAEALMFTLDSDPRLEAIGYGLNGWEALELTASHEPDVILVGSRLTGLDSLEFTRLVHELFPNVLLIVLCERLVPADVEACYSMGAADCLPMSRSADQLLHAISAARRRQETFERGRSQAQQRAALRLVHGGETDGRS